MNASNIKQKVYKWKKLIENNKQAKDLSSYYHPKFVAVIPKTFWEKYGDASPFKNILIKVIPSFISNYLANFKAYGFVYDISMDIFYPEGI